MATVTTTVAAGTVLNTLTSISYSANVPVYDDQFAGFESGSPGSIALPDSPAKFKASGMTAMRFPGGTPSDSYHPFGLTYKVGTTFNPTPDHTQWCGTPNSKYLGDISTVRGNGTSDFDDVMRNIVVPQNLNLIYTHNYGSNVHDVWGANNHYGNATAGGDPVEAACVANYINSNGWASRVQWHEVGNENYGSWEPDYHPAQWDATTYGNAYLAYRTAIKAINPAFKVVAVLQAPSPGAASAWNQTVLSLIGSVVDAVCIHLYPVQNGHEVDAQILTASYGPSGTDSAQAYSIPVVMNGGTLNGQTALGVHQYLQTACGSNPLGYQNIPILVTETNITPQYSTPATTGIVGALFLADYCHTWVDSGATTVTWHDYHNGANGGGAASFQAYPWGDYGLISSNQGYTQSTTGGNAYGKPSIQDGWIYPKYYAMQMLASMGNAGDSVVAVTTSNPLVRGHAVLRANGTLTIMLINTDFTNSYTDTITYSGFTGSTVASVQRFDPSHCPITTPPTPVTAASAPATVSATSTGFTDTIIPYSINVYTINPVGTPVSGQTISTSGTSVTYSAGQTTVTPGGTVTLSTTVTGTVNGGPYGLTWLVYDPSNTLQTGLPQMSTGALAAGTSVTLSHTYTVPSAATVGTWTVKARVTSADYTTTTYTTDASAINMSVLAVAATGGNSTVGSSYSVSEVSLNTLVDVQTSDGYVHQGAVILTPTSRTHPFYNAKVPVTVGLDLNSLAPTTLATDNQLKTLANLLSGAGSLATTQQVVSFYSDYPLGNVKNTVHTNTDAITDTGVLATAGITSLYLQIVLGTQTAASGTPQVQFWIERMTKNGGWDQTAGGQPAPLWTNTYPGTTPNQIITQTVTVQSSGVNPVIYAGLTDQTRVRWLVTSNAGGAATSNFSLQVWGR